MPITPEDFYNSAKELAQGEREIDQRNSMSRAYYATFSECRNFAGNVHPSQDDRGSHDAYINFFIKFRVVANEIDKLHMRVGHKLRQAKDFRVRADYNMDETCTESDAKQTLKIADDISSLLAEITNKATAQESEG